VRFAALSVPFSLQVVTMMMTLRASFLRCFTLAAIIALLSLVCPQTARAQQGSFVATRGQFLLNGKPFRIISGEMHYARVPRAYWRDRLRMAKAMGLNAVTTYVFWNAHEPQPGVFDFSGDLDVAEFVREAQQEGLYVILRPVPTPALSGNSAVFRRGC
jgi:beta-galactosidase